jgi:hypothetical protein
MLMFCFCFGMQVGTYDYAGCMGVPRLLYLNYDSLWQEPVPELKALRLAEDWHETELPLLPSEPVALPRVWGNFLDLELTFRQGSAPMVGLLIRSWNASGEGGAAVLYNWETQVLEVVFEALDPSTMAFSLTAPTARTIGGRISQQPGQPLQLRVLLDYSVLEVFTGTGEVLSTRVYRGTPPSGADAGLEFVAIDGTATLARVAAYEMKSIWKADLVASLREAAAAAGEEKGAPDEELFESVLSSKESNLAPVSKDGSVNESGSLIRPKSAEQLSRSMEQLGGLLGGMVLGDGIAGMKVGQEHLDGVGGFDLLSLGGVTKGQELVPEEEMTADIFLMT